jgi:hypothetical protein
MAREKMAKRFFYDAALLSGHLQFPLQPTQLLFLWRLMPTADKDLLSIIVKLLASVVQRPIGNAQLTCHLRLRVSTPLNQLHRFQFEFLRQCSPFFWHAVLPLEILFQVYLLQERPVKTRVPHLTASHAGMRRGGGGGGGVGGSGMGSSSLAT